MNLTTTVKFSSIALALLLAHCSPKTEAPTESTQPETTQSSTTENSDTPEGMRKGKLKIEVSISQTGGDQPAGAEAVQTSWNSKLTLVSEDDVYIVNDLRPYVTSGPLADTLIGDYEPFSYIDQNVNGITSSEVNYTASRSLKTKDASENVQGTYNAKVTRVYLQGLHPSLFGPGYEAYLRLNTLGKLSINGTISAPGVAAIPQNDEKEKDDEIIFSLHPVPNKDKLNDYDVLPEGIDQSTKDMFTKKNMEMLDLLNQTYADTLPVQAQIRAGAVTEATKDKLTLTYKYTGVKDIGLAAMLGVTAGGTKTNDTTIVISLY